MPTVNRVPRLAPSLAHGGPAIARQMPFTMGERIKMQREMIVKNQFTILGRLHWILLDHEGMRVPNPQEAVYQRNLFDWQGIGPMLGLSADEQDLLILNAVPHPPDITVTDTQKFHYEHERASESYPHGREIAVIDTPAKKIEQRYRDRTCERFRLDGMSFLHFCPVAKILIKPKGYAAWQTLSCETGFDDTRTAFLVNRRTGRGHFVGGRFVLGSHK